MKRSRLGKQPGLLEEIPELGILGWRLVQPVSLLVEDGIKRSGCLHKVVWTVHLL